MNYRLNNYKFAEIKERQGFIENNSGAILELCITNGVPVPDSTNNLYLNPHNKYNYTLKEGEKLYAKLVTRITGCINIYEGNVGGSPESIPANIVIFDDKESLQKKLEDGTLSKEYDFKLENGHLILYKL